nr:MAG TPA_asm: hypothetical protein [Caudoviricetes sp.]
MARPFSSDPLTLPFFRSFLQVVPFSPLLSPLPAFPFLYGFPSIAFSTALSFLPYGLFFRPFSFFLSALLFWSVCVGSFYWAVLICDSFIVSLWCFCVVLSWVFSFVGVWVMACRAGFVRSFSLLFG